MSHFGVLVLISPLFTNDEDINDAVAAELAPFDENKEGLKRKTECYCINSEASSAVSEMADAKLGTIDTARDAFHAKIKAMETKPTEEEKQAMWTKDIWEPRHKFEKEEIKKHPLHNKPKKDCEDCSGTGLRDTTSNPLAKWDWWVIGGRWTGYLGGVDPCKNPLNFETCFLCQGTGKRDDHLGQQARLENPAYTCNGCEGSGKKLKHAPKWVKEASDTQVIMDIQKENRDKIHEHFYSILVDGVWHTQGDMGWFGISNDQMNDEQWAEHVRKLLEAHQEKKAVVVDCHI